MKESKFILGHYFLFLIVMTFTAGLCVQKTYASGAYANQKKTALSDFKTPMHRGIVKSVKNAGIYTYVEVAGKSETLWVAVSKTAVEIGEMVSFPKKLPMKNFKSKNLKKIFKLVYFSSELRIAGKIKEKKSSSHLSQASKTKIYRNKITLGSIKKADVTIGDLWEKRKALSGKDILIRGKVVKVTPKVMNKNWFHLQDGSGTKKFYDLVVTSSKMAKVGDIILVKGKVVTNKNFGYGYFYKLLIENAKIIK